MGSDHAPSMFDLFYFFHESKWILELKPQVTNCVHGYNRAHNVHINGVMRTRKFVHDIDSSVLKKFESANLLLRPLSFK